MPTESLSDSQALKLLKAPPNRMVIADGVKYESGIRIWTLPLIPKELQQEDAWRAYDESLMSQLTPAKYNALYKSFTFPLTINNISNDIMLDLYKVFDGRNASFSVNYPDNNSRAKEMGDVLLAELSILNWIREEGKKVLKCAPNTVVVLDKDEHGDPKILAIPNKRIWGTVSDSEGNFEVFMFIHSKGMDGDKPWTKYGYYDSASYRVWKQQDGNWSEPFTAPHDLGYCPARFFYDNPRVDKHHFDRSIPLTPVIGEMVNWQTLNVMDTHQYKSMAFQAVELPMIECSNTECEDGQIYVKPEMDVKNVVTVEGYHRKCPTCASNALVGPGTSFEVDVGVNKEDMDARGVFRYIAPKVDALESAGVKNAQRRNDIKEAVVGYSSNITSEAINPIQVSALVESRKLVLFDIKHHLEELYKWIVKGTVKLVYDIDVTANANYGTEFFILTPSDIVQLIKDAKAAGVSSMYLAQLHHELIQTEHKSDPMLAERMKIGADLEPNAYDTQEEARKKASEFVMTKEDYYIKSNFIDLINQFEREFGDILTFWNDMSYGAKITQIKKKLLEYSNEKLNQNEQQKQSDNDKDKDDSAKPSSASD